MERRRDDLRKMRLNWLDGLLGVAGLVGAGCALAVMFRVAGDPFDGHLVMPLGFIAVCLLLFLIWLRPRHY